MYGDKQHDQPNPKNPITMTNRELYNIRRIYGLQSENRMFRRFNFVMIVICIVLICLLSNSCKSKQSIVGTTSQTHTNTTVTTTFKDTVINVHFVAMPPVFVSIPLRDTTPSDTAFVETPTAKAMAFVKNGNLHLSVQEKDTTIAMRIPNAIRETAINQTTQSKETTVIQEKAKSRFGDTLIERILILLGLLLLVYLGISITRKRTVL